MSAVTKKLMSSAGAGAAAFTAIEDVFSTYLYAGTQSTFPIQNGIDLAGEGGLVWIKSRNNAGAVSNHVLLDTQRGASTSTAQLSSNTTGAAATGYLDSYNSDGFTLKSNGGALYNFIGGNYVSWTFRKAPRFFDVVTYTGTGSARTIDHNLGTTVGSIIIKRTDTTSNWAVYHRGNTAAPETDFLSLNLTSPTADDATYWNDTAPTDSVFTVGTNAVVNASGGTYVAYLFAHDPLGPSEDGSDGLIACGSYTGNGSATGPEIDLGWEPQWLLIKDATSSSWNWMMVDAMRGCPVNGPEEILMANTAGASQTPSTITAINLTPTGFKIADDYGAYNTNGNTYIYIAIRRGPMRQPTSGTEVFDVDAYSGNSTLRTIPTGFPTDLVIIADRSGDGLRSSVWDRLRGFSHHLATSSINAEQTYSAEEVYFDRNDGYGLSTSTFQGIVNFSGYGGYIGWSFRRAPGFFDVVAYTGNGVAGRTVPHNLGVAPEMMITKRRSGTSNWRTYVQSLGADKALNLNTIAASFTNTDYWNSTHPTASVFTIGSVEPNLAGDTYIAYLFATLPGVSKVGSYTGNGTSQTINCGFTSGARFILIKRTDSTGDWYVWDTARGIVAANDPHLSLNTTANEVTTDDSIDPDSSGFIVNQVAATNINVNAASYIFYAIA